MAALPTLYEYYTPGGVINSGLNVSSPEFKLNDKDFRLYSGAMHYFRIPRVHWRDRLKKLRAAGLNTVETYVPWNLHQPEMNKYDFGNNGTDMESFLDLQEYLKIAQEEDLFAIVRPGPFICAEWEFGGLPSWLLREEGCQVRTNDSKFMQFVTNYFNVLLPILAALQFMNGGPIIAFQVENEYGSSPIIDLDYVQGLHDLMRSNGIVELLVTSDPSGSRQRGTIPGLLFQTINFGSNPDANLDVLKEMQPNQPYMVMEFWSGWFDHWTESHHTVANITFASLYESILKYPASVNLYMFHGGTNFGFMNGANFAADIEMNMFFQPTTTSYDYDAPLNEAGDYTDKYYIVKELIEKYNPVKTLTPEMPELEPRIAYPTIPIDSQIEFGGILEKWSHIEMAYQTFAMEDLMANDKSGQSYGYLVYETTVDDLPANSELQITDFVRDTVMVVLNDKLVSKQLTSKEDLNSFGYYRTLNSTLNLQNEEMKNFSIYLIIENWGRVNFGPIYHQKKGLTEQNSVLINGEVVKTLWIMYTIEFKKQWNLELDSWNNEVDFDYVGPALYHANLTLTEEPKDTYVNMEGWSKGIVIVNGFVLGRYSLLGPQKSLYLPSEFLSIGNNNIIIFEHFKAGNEITFSTDLLFY